MTALHSFVMLVSHSPRPSLYLARPERPFFTLGFSSTELGKFAIIKHQLDDPEHRVCSLQLLLSYRSSSNKVAEPVGLGYVWQQESYDPITSSTIVLRTTDSTLVPEYHAPGIT